jgi:DnaJ-class molecular chaperone
MRSTFRGGVLAFDRGALFGQSEPLLRGQDKRAALEVPLESLMLDHEVKVSIVRDRICGLCLGAGAEKHDTIDCVHCGGSGRARVTNHLGGTAEFTQHLTNVCSECAGHGSVPLRSKHCKRCQGKRTVSETVEEIVTIPAGAPVGHTITLYGAADERPFHKPGDVVFDVAAKPHANYTREPPDWWGVDDAFTTTKDDSKNANMGHLFATVNLTLREALLGFDFEVGLRHGRRGLPSVNGSAAVAVHRLRRAGITRPGHRETIFGEGLVRYDYEAFVGRKDRGSSQKKKKTRTDVGGQSDESTTDELEEVLVPERGNLYVYYNVADDDADLGLRLKQSNFGWAGKMNNY